MTAWYSILHFLVDGVCALAMFGSFLPGGHGHTDILVYNFCAFAMQMPLGLALDMANLRYREKEMEIAFAAAVAGVCCTIAGAFVHPSLLGLGNALFHLGGGFGAIKEDHTRRWEGRGLGVFVAPGAIGLYFGTWIAKQGVWKMAVLGAGVWMAVICIRLAYLHRKWRKQDTAQIVGSLAAEDCWNGVVWCAVSCLAVVILRSYLGMAVSFPWNTSFGAGLLAVIALAGGKAAGGFCAARYGFWKTSAVSLALAAFCYLFLAVMPIGLAALFFFNITMPVTLYWMVCMFQSMPGFAFGSLTFGLFCGFLPGYFGILPQAGAGLVGCAASLLSILFLFCGKIYAGKIGKDLIKPGSPGIERGFRACWQGRRKR